MDFLQIDPMTYFWVTMSHYTDHMITDGSHIEICF